MLKVLVLDDEKPVRRAIRYMLQASVIDTFQIFEAFNGEEGYRLFLDESPDIILRDINMPRTNGIDFLERTADYLERAQATINYLREELNRKQK